LLVTPEGFRALAQLHAKFLLNFFIEIFEQLAARRAYPILCV
jgi:hypothetical protein